MSQWMKGLTGIVRHTRHGGRRALSKGPCQCALTFGRASTSRCLSNEDAVSGQTNLLMNDLRDDIEPRRAGVYFLCFVGGSPL